MTLHRHLFSPRYRPTGSITACAMSVARALAYIQSYGWERLNRTPELRTAAVEMDAAQIKANREGFTFTTVNVRLQRAFCRVHK